MTKALFCSFAFFAVCFWQTAASASDPTVVEWPDLLPPKVFEDPYEKLSDEQLQDLSDVVRVRSLLANERIRSDAHDVQEALRTEQSLRKQGVDIEWLLSQRDRVRQMRARQASAVVPDWNEKRIAIAGYVIPVRMNKGRLTEFFLVASANACSHAKLPPPNQLVFVELSDGVALGNRLEPVVVTGLIMTRSTKKTLMRGSGFIPTAAAYTLVSASIEPYSGR